MDLINKSRLRLNLGFTLLELLISVSVLVVLLVIAFPAYNGVKAYSKNAGCISNLRSLFVALNYYANDNNECYPANRVNGVAWPSLIASYLPVPPGQSSAEKVGITYCPSTSVVDSGERVDGRPVFLRDAGTWRTDYNVNPYVFSEELSRNKRSLVNGSTVLLFEGPGGINLARSYNRHRLNFNVLFAAGQVQSHKDIAELKELWQKK